MDYEQELERVAEQYREEGYGVVIRPTGGQLPAFAAGFGADLIATRGHENALVRVKMTRTDLAADPTVAAQASVVNEQPGWRFDLVILRKDDPFSRLARHATEPSVGQIEETLHGAERLADAGFLPAALVQAWAGLEAVLRRAGRGAEPGMPPIGGELLAGHYGSGSLSKEEYTALKQSFQARGEIVHGFAHGSISAEALTGVVEAARRLLTSKPEDRRIAV